MRHIHTRQTESWRPGLNKPDPAKKNIPLASSEDIRRLFRDVSDHTVAAILALHPTLAQLEEAELRTGGVEDIFADHGPAEGVVAEIVELVRMEEDEFEEPREAY